MAPWVPSVQAQGPEFDSWVKLSDMDVISPGWEAEKGFPGVHLPDSVAERMCYRLGESPSQKIRWRTTQEGTWWQLLASRSM